MEQFNLEEKLKDMRPKPLTKEEKNMLWFRIEQKLKPKREAQFGRLALDFFLGSGKRLAYAVLVILVLIGATGVTFRVADAAKPGDFLFPVDLAAEKVRIALASDKKKDELRVRFAEERLDEAKSVLASISIDIEAAADIHDASATSTDDNLTDDAISGTSTAQNTATSSGDATTTPEENKNKDEDANIDSEKITRAQKALELALEQLEKTRQTFEAKGNIIALAAIDRIIAELNALAEEHIAKLDKFETRIKDDGKKLKVEIKISNDELKAKFRLEQKNTDGEKGKNTDIRIKDTDSRTELKLKDSGLKLELKIKDQDKNKRDHDDDEDENKDDDKNEKILVCHIPDGNSNRQRTLRVSERSSKAHLGHGDHLGRCSEDDDKDSVSPVISDIVANAATTTANVSWKTNEESDSKVWYGTSTPLIISGVTASKSSSALVKNHVLALSGLNASTTYHFVVVSKDSSGNTSTSSQSSFGTLKETPPPDITPPIISGVSASAITASSSAISWNTNEAATSKIWYATSTPLVISNSTPKLINSSLVTNHALTLSGLNASSTYYYLVTSSDSSGNTATSSESFFLTLP